MRASNVSQIPQRPHWAIVSFGTITIPGDERSRTHPGHGYPESSESVSYYDVFEDEASWKKEIERRCQPTPFSVPDRNFIALQVTPAAITTRVEVRIS